MTFFIYTWQFIYKKFRLNMHASASQSTTHTTTLNMFVQQSKHQAGLVRRRQSD